MNPQDHLGEPQPYYFVDLHVHLHSGTVTSKVKPAWYDLPRRLGLRKLKTISSELIKPGAMFFLTSAGIVIIRHDDWDKLRKHCEPLPPVQAAS